MDNTCFPDPRSKAPSSRLAGLRLGRRLERIQSRTTTKGLMKRRAEMAQAAVAHFARGFGHIAFPGAQQFGGALHANLTKVLLNRQADFLREETAEIKRTAPDQATQ